jgi:ketosteroid isomerase-like protein
MSQENVDLNHQANDAFNRRDLHAFLALMDHDVEFIPYELAVQGGDPYRGHDGVRRWWEETLSVLPDIRVETYEIRDHGERNFVHGRLSVVGRIAPRCKDLAKSRPMAKVAA